MILTKQIFGLANFLLPTMLLLVSVLETWQPTTCLTIFAESGLRETNTGDPNEPAGAMDSPTCTNKTEDAIGPSDDSLTPNSDTENTKLSATNSKYCWASNLRFL